MIIRMFATRSGATLTLAALAACSPAKPTTAPAPSAAATASTGGAPVATTAGSSTVAPTVMQGLGAAPARNKDRQLLSRDEIVSTQYTNLYDVIATLRGNWLRIRAAESIQGQSSRLQVYLDTQRLNGVEDLRQLRSVNIESVRFLDPIQASARWGMDHGSGAILVTTAKR